MDNETNNLKITKKWMKIMGKNYQKNCLNVLKEISEIKSLGRSSDFKETYELFKNRLNDDEFRIAVVGEFSSGKSTFINALIGKDILKHGATETTAVITKIKNVKPDDKLSYKGKVVFSNKKIKILDNINALNEFTTTNSEKYKVVNDIKTVELYVPIAVNTKNITIVDTPGLNGMADGHREQTVEIIKTAHACIYILPARGISESDINFLNYLLHYQKNFIFVQNFIDKIKSAENESVEDKLKDLSEVLDKKVINNFKGVNYYICGVSALYELVGKDKNLNFGNNYAEEITEQERLIYRQKSHFDDFRKILKDEFSDDKLQRIQFEGTAWAIYEWCNELLDDIELRYKQILDIYEISTEKKQKEQLEKVKENINKNFEKQKNQLADLVISEVAKIEKENKNDLLKEFSLLYENLIEYLNNTLNNSISANDVESVVADTIKEINYKLLNVNIIVDKQLETCSLQFQALYHVLKRRIEEYTGISRNDDELNISIQNSNRLELNINDNKISDIEKEKEEKINERLKAKKEIAENEMQIKTNNANINNLNRLIENAEKQRKIDVNRLGSRPSAVARKEYYTVYRDRTGILGGIAQFFCGQKKETKSRTVYDDSAGEVWDREKRNIESRYNNNIFEYSNKIKELNSLKLFASGKINAAKVMLADIESDIENLEKDIAQEKSIKELKIKVLKEKYIEDCKNNLKKQLGNHLLESGDTYSEIIDNLESDLKAAREEMIIKVQTEYEKNIKERLKIVDKMNSGQKSELIKELNNLKTDYKKLKSIVELMGRNLNE